MCLSIGTRTDDANKPTAFRSILANAVQSLLQGGEKDAASMLLSCNLELEEVNEFHGGTYRLHVCLRAPRPVFNIPNVVVKKFLYVLDGD